jgi:cob(I)alamin adenosyltransferase
VGPPALAAGRARPRAAGDVGEGAGASVVSVVNLTRIYTRTGDTGTTSLGDMSRTAKTDPRLVAYADVDEANAHIGVALALGDLDADVAEVLTRVQNELFDVGADLCTPVIANPPVEPLRVEEAYVDRLESDCDRFNDTVEKLRSFILPGGTPGSALLHVARTAVRRAERSTWTALDAYGPTMNPLTARYLNRLSDLLFILSRVANLPASGGHGDVLWKPGGDR